MLNHYLIFWLSIIFSQSNGAATGQRWCWVAIYSHNLPWWEMTILDTRSSQWPTDTFTTVGGATVTLLEEQVMLTPRSETNLSQRRRSQSLAGKYLLGTQRDFSHSFHRFGFSIRESKLRDVIPLLIVWWSYDSMKEEEQRNKCYVFTSSSFFLERSHLLPTITESLLRLQ